MCLPFIDHSNQSDQILLFFFCPKISHNLWSTTAIKSILQTDIILRVRWNFKWLKKTKFLIKQTNERKKKRKIKFSKHPSIHSSSSIIKWFTQFMEFFVVMFSLPTLSLLVNSKKKLVNHKFPPFPLFAPLAIQISNVIFFLSFFVLYFFRCCCWTSTTTIMTFDLQEIHWPDFKFIFFFHLLFAACFLVFIFFWTDQERKKKNRMTRFFFKENSFIFISWFFFECEKQSTNVSDEFFVVVVVVDAILFACQLLCRIEKKTKKKQMRKKNTNHHHHHHIKREKKNLWKNS